MVMRLHHQVYSAKNQFAKDHFATWPIWQIEQITENSYLTMYTDDIMYIEWKFKGPFKGPFKIFDAYVDEFKVLIYLKRYCKSAL